MIRLFITLLLTTLTLNSGIVFSQQDDNWEWLNPKPQGNTLYALDFANDNIGYAAGMFGTIIKTTDNGVNWNKLKTGTSETFYAVDFTDAQTGYAGGFDQLMKKTTNGGLTWTDLSLPAAPNFNVLDIKFINSTTGYVLGFFIFESRIWKTTDGGQTWATQTTGGANYLNKLYFIDENNGFGAGGALGGEVVKTTNGGNNWNLVYTDNYSKRSIKFINATTGFVGSDNGRVYKTFDGGNTWSFAYSDASMDITSINFTDANTGFAFGTGSAYAKTTDGGLNWFEHIFNTGGTSQYFDSEISSNGNINVIGNYGAMIRSTDAGATFVSPVNVSDGYITDIKFVNQTTGYAVTGFSDGDILKTTDAGFSWVSQISSFTLSIYSIAFTTETTGYLAGTLNLYKTTNGGTNWNTILTSTSDFYVAIEFTDLNTGFVMATNGKMLKTTDAGATWNPMTNPNAAQGYVSLNFSDANTGYAVGDRKGVKTTNAGVIWTNMTLPSGVITFNNIFFEDVNTGYLSSNEGIYKSTNAGDSWLRLNTPVGGFNEVQFRGSFGYAIAGDGKIIKSTDAGTSWITQSAVTENALYALYFNSDNFVYAGGIKGTILKTIPTELVITGVSSHFNEIPNSVQLSQNYPNPFNPSTKINYALPGSGNVRLTVYDVSGKEITKLVNTQQAAGQYTVQFDASSFSSGVYFYKLDLQLSSGTYSRTMKMVLAK